MCTDRTEAVCYKARQCLYGSFYPNFNNFSLEWFLLWYPWANRSTSTAYTYKTKQNQKQQQQQHTFSKFWHLCLPLKIMFCFEVFKSPTLQSGLLEKVWRRRSSAGVRMKGHSCMCRQWDKRSKVVRTSCAKQDFLCSSSILSKIWWSSVPMCHRWVRHED